MQIAFCIHYITLLHINRHTCGIFDVLPKVFVIYYGYEN